MAGYLTANNVTNLTGAFFKLWQTTSANTNITIYKEPTRTLVASSYSGVTWAGFPGDSISENDYTYTTVTGIFPTIIKDGNKPGNPEKLEDIPIKLGRDQVIIKVERNAKDYIDSGKTEKIELNDGRVYNNFSLYSTQNYFGLIYYYYLLDRTT